MVRPTLLFLAPFLAAALGAPAAPTHSSPSCPEVDFPVPPHYVAFKRTRPISIDGNIHDADWKSVPWTDEYTLQYAAQEDVPAAPAGSTRSKLLWDDKYLYVATYLEDHQIQADPTHTHDSELYTSNNWELFVDADGSGANYKELEFNALGVILDLQMSHPWNDGGMWDLSYESGAKAAIRLNGAGCQINLDNNKCKGWWIEVRVPLQSLAADTTANLPPKDGDHWRIQLGRTQHLLKTTANKTYEVADNGSGYAWAPSGFLANFHAPDRWGFLQFSHLSSASAPSHPAVYQPDPTWPLRQVLLDVYYAQLNLTSADQPLATTLSGVPTLPAHVAKGTCGVSVPKLQSDGDSWNATAVYRDLRGLITSQRELTITKA
ncbi:hypothetical protein HDV00_007742 [Rhizophlyctis rosea]|nr:hypothetical protein HDV00_007742 [Rhizophlyctis rosea]